MKRLLIYFTLITWALLTIPTQVSAQTADTLDIAPLPVGNVNNVIVGDTLAGGLRAHPNRVYRLTRGSIYQVTAPFIINGSIKIVATRGTNRPPVLAPAILPDGSSIGDFFRFYGKGSSVQISNVYLISIRADGAQLGWSTGMSLNADSIKLKLRGVIFDGFTASGLSVNAHWSKMDVQDCDFRNLMHATSWFGGQPFISGAPIHMDTCKFINNTFFSCNSYLWSVRGYDKYSVFEHNTIVYGIVNPFLTRQGSNLHIKNNLFYSAHSMGGNPDHVINGWFLNYPDTSSSSIIYIRGLDSTSYWSKLWGGNIAGTNVYLDPNNGVTQDMLDPSKRVFELKNNAYFWPKKLTDFYKAYNDTVKLADSVDVPKYGQSNEIKAYLKRKLIMPTWLNNYAQWTIDSLFVRTHVNTQVANNINQDPGFSDANVLGQVDKVIDYVHKICTNTLDVPWFFDPNNALYPPAWPLPENLAYTNTTMQTAGTDGYALGDLNWFPAQKAQWLVTDVKAEPNSVKPTEYTLSQNYPNPFNPTTVIKFSVPVTGFYTLKVYNILGQEVAQLLNGQLNPGSYSATFDATRLSTGVYFYNLTGNNVNITKKMMLIK